MENQLASTAAMLSFADITKGECPTKIRSPVSDLVGSL